MNSPEKQIEQALDRYVRSVNALDVALARELWLKAPEVSFIHPRGYETGIENIIKSFYLDTMGRFKSRNLRRKNTVILVQGQTAVATFDWDFDAVFASDDSPLTTRGRESQVFVRLADGTWKLAHVHYSALRDFGEREGF